jgi:hypothetical protein
MRLAAISLTLCTCTFAPIAGAQFHFQTPSDNELHSSYCQAVLKWQIADLQAGLNKAEAGENAPPMSPELQQYVAKQRAEGHEMLAKLQTAWNRIDAYLTPKFTLLEPLAMLTALQRGEADWRDFMAMADRCTKKCYYTTPMLPKDEAGACFNSCKDDALIARINACADPTWLPF